MSLTLKVVNNEQVKASATAEQAVQLLYREAYVEGDAITLETTEPCFLVVQLEDSLAPTYVYLTGSYVLPIPFGAQRVVYSPKSFTGAVQFISARYATAAEIAQRKNLCLNAYDYHQNTGMFPHSFANVETRNEAVFASRNAIDGVCAEGGHGDYPFQSWGVNQQADAEITVDFGRTVNIDEIGITLRSDFPHDNWWQSATVRFSDGSVEVVTLEKTAQTQYFPVTKTNVTSVTLCEMKKDETDPSPFPALMQLEAFGFECTTK